MKRTLAFILLIFVLGAIGYFGVRVYQEAAAEQAVQRRIQTLPDVALTTVDGEAVRPTGLSGDTPAVLVFFRPSCSYCQHEARSIRTFGVERVPTTFVYGREGTLVRRFEGEVGASALYEALSSAPSPAVSAAGS